MFSWLRTHLSVIAFAVSAVALIFLAGLTVGHLGLPPANLVRDTIAAATDLRINGAAYFFGVPTRHLQPRRSREDGLIIFNPDRMAPGVTFMTGLFGQTLGARLYAPDGTLIHEWPIDFFQIAPDEMSYRFDALIHGDHLYPNGDFVANLDGRGIVRVSTCGEILWQNRNGSHHALWVDEAGYLWTPVTGPRYDEPSLWSGPFWFDRIGRFDPQTGELVDEIDLVAALVTGQVQGLALSNSIDTGDVMHLNDVEILSTELAEAFPEFAAGDILLSSRNFSQIWILDAVDHKLKWWFNGPMVGQHDPDFQPDGTITLFDNRTGLEGGSRIIRIDPTTRQYETVFTSDEATTFSSTYRGKHQMLDNGNVLITETDGGRALEVTEGGDVVWSFVNGWDETRVGWIMSATRYPPEYAAIGEIDCIGE